MEDVEAEGVYDEGEGVFDDEGGDGSVVEAEMAALLRTRGHRYF